MPPPARPPAHDGCTSPDDAEIPADVVRLMHLYQCERWSTYRIAALVGFSHQRIARTLRRHGVALRSRGRGGTRPDRRREDPADLEALLRAWYVEARMTSGQIADKLSIPERLVRTRLAEFGITRRNRGPLNREDRHRIEPEIIEHWYTDLQLTAAEVAAVTTTSRGVVLRNAHEQGIPVRMGGPPAHRGPTEITLIDALYTDPIIAAIVTEHRLPIAAAGPPLHQRFPTPIPLTEPLLRVLYCHAGVAATHIELLTGQPTITVIRALHATGIPTRGRGGRCPFLRRWRLTARADILPASPGRADPREIRCRGYPVVAQICAR